MVVLIVAAVKLFVGWQHQQYFRTCDFTNGLLRIDRDYFS